MGGFFSARPAFSLFRVDAHNFAEHSEQGKQCATGNID
jgi:hypothetical protein